MRLKTLLVIMGFIAAIMFLLCMVMRNKKTVIRSIEMPNGGVASIVSRIDSALLLTYRADLVFFSTKGYIVYETNLLRNRDSIEDIRNEFISLEAYERVLNLKATGNHYRGTNIFSLPNGK